MFHNQSTIIMTGFYVSPLMSIENNAKPSLPLSRPELERSNYLRRINAEFLKDSPGSLQILRMATAPPLARDRLIGLAYVTPNLVNSMEGKTNIPSRLLLIALFYRSMLSRTTYPLLLKQNLPATSPIQTNAVRKKHRN